MRGRSLKIDKPTTPVSTTPVSSGRANRAGAEAPAPAPTAQDSVNITTLSAQLQALEGKLSSIEVVDTARVQAIKDAIAEGRFKINPEVIADRLLDTARELIRDRKA